jgi:hypothetical protein
MLLRAAACIWLVGALCHENSKISNGRKGVILLARGRSGQKYGGSEGVTIRMWIGGGQTHGKVPGALLGVDNYLLITGKGSTLRVLHRYPSQWVEK